MQHLNYKLPKSFRRCLRSLIVGSLAVTLWPAESPGWMTDQNIKTELQWALCESSVDDFVSKVGARIIDKDEFSISYLDSRQLALLENGLSLTLETKSKGGKLVTESKLKINVPTMEAIDLDWLNDQGGKCENDRYGNTLRLRCSLAAQVRRKSSMLSKEQRFLLDTTRPDFVWPVLRLWGPYKGQNFKADWSSSPLSHDTIQKLSLKEIWVQGPQQAPTPLIELSLRVPGHLADPAYRSVSTVLESLNVRRCEDQEGIFLRLLEQQGPESAPIDG